MRGKPCILSLFANSVINSIKHEHSCQILYLMKKGIFKFFTDSRINLSSMTQYLRYGGGKCQGYQIAFPEA